MNIAPAAPTRTAASLGQRLLRGSGWAFLGRALALPVGLLQTMLLARLLAPAELGGYFLAVSLASLAAIVAQIGMARALVKLVASAIATGRPAAARQAIRLALLLTCTVGVLAALALADGPGRWIARLLADPERLQAVLPIIALLVVGLALIDLFAETFRGFHDIRAASLFGDQLLHRLLLVGALGVVWALAMAVDLSAVLWIAAIAAAGGVLLGSLVLRRRLAGLGHDGEVWGAYEVLRHGPPFMLVRLNLWLLAGADLWLLGMFRAPEEVAIYGAASRIALLVGAPLVIANAALAPVIAELHSQRRRNDLEKAVRAAATLSGLPALGLAVALILFGDSLLALFFTEAYREGYPVLVCLAIAQWLHVAFGSCAISLTMSGHQRDVMIASSVTAIATVAGFYLVAAPYGALGVGVVAGSSLALYNGVLALIARRRLGIATWMTLSLDAFRHFSTELRRTLGNRS